GGPAPRSCRTRCSGGWGAAASDRRAPPCPRGAVPNRRAGRSGGGHRGGNVTRGRRSGNPHNHVVSTVAGIRFKVTPNQSPAPTAERERRLASPGFGRVFTDHMI